MARTLTWDEVYRAAACYKPSRFHDRGRITVADLAALVNRGDIPGLTARTFHMPDTRMTPKRIERVYGPQPKRSPQLGLALYSFGGTKPVREFNFTVGGDFAIRAALTFLKGRHEQAERRRVGREAMGADAHCCVSPE